jgi:hypothetical protein
MRVTVRLPDELGEEVKRRTDNVSAYVTEALSDRVRKEKRDEARRRLRRFAGTGGVDPDLHKINQRQRREGDRDFEEAQSLSQAGDR